MSLKELKNLNALDVLMLRLGVVLLVFNVCLVSIPRCDLVLRVLQHGMILPGSEVSPSDCHDPLQTSRAQKAIQADHLCRCSLLSFVFFVVALPDHERFLIFKAVFLRLLVFPEKAWIPGHGFGPEPPYPKFV